ncbi:MAG: 4-hydroxy-tetrahydrodipicolinate synthase [Parachlamydiales bacterium]|nr:4-hydroxy-tetrahydrodipicolinate synthase [Parachlamydiales bacterium]
MFCGSYVAVVTPFSENGEIDSCALSELVQWHIEQNTDGIVCCGTTGESPTLSLEEKDEIIRICVKASKGKIKIVAGTGTNDTLTSVQHTRRALELGADGCMAVVPYYNRPTQKGVIEHFRYIASVGLPLIIYNHPGRTGTIIQPQTFGKLEKIPNVVAIKDASGKIETTAEIRKHTSLPIFSGDDALTVFIMELGGVGGISVLANIIPSVCKHIIELCRNGDFSRAKEVFQQYKKLNDVLFLETNPQCVKYALSLMRKCHKQMRMPLLEPTVANKHRISEVLKEYFPILSPTA